MGKRLVTKSGNDNIYTPYELAKSIVEYINPNGMMLEPCMGDGAFTTVFSERKLEYEWCEIDKGRDYFTHPLIKGYYDWIITNPPFSKIRKFLLRSYELEAKNIAFLMPINAIWMNGKLNDMKSYNYGLTDIFLCQSPYERRMNGWKQSGFSIGVVILRKDCVHPFINFNEIKW